MLPDRIRASNAAHIGIVCVVTALTMLLLSLLFDTSGSLIALAAISGASAAAGVVVAALFRTPKQGAGPNNGDV